MRSSKSGSEILLSDVSPVTHDMAVKVSSKNLINNISAKYDCGVDLTNHENYWALNGTCTTSSNFNFEQNNLYPGTYTLSTLNSINIESNTQALIQLVLTPVNGGNTLYINLKNNYVLNKSQTFKIIKEYKCTLQIRIQKGITYDNYFLYPQLERGTAATDYVPNISDLTAVKLLKANSLGETEAEYTPNVDGTVEGVSSLYPNTILMTDTDGVIIDCEYNRDLNKALAELKAAIISLGGNV